MNNSNQNAGVKPKFLNATPAVEYASPDCTVYVPIMSNTEQDSPGDLSKLPPDWRNKIVQYSKNGFTKRKVSVDTSNSTLRVSARKILDDFNAQGYRIDIVRVIYQEEVDEKGNRRPVTLF